MTATKSTVVKHSRYTSPLRGVLEFYPESIKKIAYRGEYISRGLAHNQFLVITAKPGPSSDKPAGYHVEVYSPSNGTNPDCTVAQLDIGPNNAFVYYNRRGTHTPELYILNTPELLRDKVAWALGASRKYNEKRSMNDLRAHYEMLLTAYVEKDREDPYQPRRFSFKNFEAVVSFDEHGEADRNNSAYYIKGYPTYEEALEVLEAAKRRDGWYFSSVEKINYVISLIKANKPKSKI